MKFWGIMAGRGFWQLRLWVPRYTLRFLIERKNEEPGPIEGGWSKL